MKPGVHKHRNGQAYFAMFKARHTETGEELVIYTPLYQHPAGGTVPQARPLKMWDEIVEGKPRFEFVGECLPVKEPENE